MIKLNFSVALAVVTVFQLQVPTVRPLVILSLYRTPTLLLSHPADLRAKMQTVVEVGGLVMGEAVTQDPM